MNYNQALKHSKTNIEHIILRAIEIRPLTVEEVATVIRRSPTDAQTYLDSLVERTHLKTKVFSPYPSKTVTQYRSTGKGRSRVWRSDRDTARNLTTCA